MQNFVDLTFDCLPLRSVTRFDIPIDASPKYRARCERVFEAIHKFGTHNTYYLYSARCAFHLTNDPEIGLIEFEFEGPVTTDASDTRTISAALAVTLKREVCDWLTEPVVKWFAETVERAVKVEFDRFIAAGDLAQTLSRLAALEQQSDQKSGYLGMGL